MECPPRGGVSTELRIGGYKSSIIEKFKSDIILAFEPSEAVGLLIRQIKILKSYLTHLNNSIHFKPI